LKVKNLYNSMLSQRKLKRLKPKNRLRLLGKMLTTSQHRLSSQLRRARN